MEDQGSLIIQGEGANNTEVPNLNMQKEQKDSKYGWDLAAGGVIWSEGGPETQQYRAEKARIYTNCDGMTLKGFKRRNDIT